VTKHFANGLCALQFKIKNTVDLTEIQNVKIVKSKSNDPFEIINSEIIDGIKFDESKDNILITKFQSAFPKGKF